VAEGVETLDQLQFLRAEGCDVVQGYLMSRAIPAAALSALLRDTGARAAPDPLTRTGVAD
jgi:EAL domain-containing protein (putative c-di-GMP-specific phosphodiesterase class I)